MSTRARSRTATSVLLAALVLVLAACAPAATPSPTAAPATPAATPAASSSMPAATAGGSLELAGTSWLLVGYTSPAGANFTVPMSITPTLVFAEDTASGNAGCNTFTGNWAVDGDTIAFTGPVTSTKVACPDPGGQVEAAYLANLALVNRVQMRGENLFMYKADALPELEFMPAGN